MQIIKPTMKGGRKNRMDKMGLYLSGKNDVPVSDVIADIKAQYPNVKPGELHQAFIDNNIELTDESVTLLHE